MIVRTLLLSAAAVYSLAAGYVPRSTAAPALSDDQVLRQATARLAHARAGVVVNWLNHQSSVANAQVARDGHTLNIHFRDGTGGAILPTALSRVALPVRDLALHPRVRTHAGSGRALVLEPFAQELIGPGANPGDPEINSLKQAGFQVDQLSDEQVTVKSMANISQYNVVYMHTHSGPWAASDAVIATGQLEKTPDSSIPPLLQEGSVIRIQVSGSTQIYYGITSLFIKKYVGQFPNSSLMFINGCKLLQATTLWTTLQSKGLATLVTWDEEATDLDNYLAGAAFFAEMVTGLSVSAAIKAEQAAGYGKSTVGGKSATLGFVGDGSLTLQRAAQGGPGSQPTPIPTAEVVTPTSTAAPVATDTPIPTSTSTPAPTATPTLAPAPGIQIQLRPAVAPGTRQVVTVHTAAGARVHFKVAFPNGDNRNQDLTADGNGVAVFTFKQHASKVSYNKTSATVTIQVTVPGAAPATATKEYRIGLSKNDVSVLPRKAAEGQVVTIFVHTDPGAHIVVFLHLPKGGVKRLEGTPNKQGWASLPFRIPAGATTQGHTTVKVVATVKMHGKARRQITSFTIG